jgi:hypothetical protein
MKSNFLKLKSISVLWTLMILACSDAPTGSEDELSSINLTESSSSSGLSDSLMNVDSTRGVDSLRMDHFSSSSLISLSSSRLQSSSSLSGTLGLSQKIQSSSSGIPVLEIRGHLKLDGTGLGSILNTKAFLNKVTDGTAGSSDDELLDLKDRNGKSLGLKADDYLKLSLRGQADVRFKVVSVAPNPGQREIQTISDLIAEINTYLGSHGTCSLVNGQLQIAGAGAGVPNFEINSENSFSASKIAYVFYFPSNIAAGDVEMSEVLLRPATGMDPLNYLLNEDGVNLGFEPGDIITVGATVGGGALRNQTTLTFNPVSSTLGNVLDLIRDNLRLPMYNSGIEEHPSLSVNRAGTDDNLVDGSIVVRGMTGESYELRGLVVSASNANGSLPAPIFFNRNMEVTTLQNSKDIGSYSSQISIPACDTKTIDLDISYTWSSWNEFIYEISTQNVGIDLIVGKTGAIVFDPDGSLNLSRSELSGVEIDASNICSQMLKFNLDFDGLLGKSGVDSKLSYNWLR